MDKDKDYKKLFNSLQKDLVNDVIAPKSALCKCGNDFLIYNNREGLNICTLCGKSKLK